MTDNLHACIIFWGDYLYRGIGGDGVAGIDQLTIHPTCHGGLGKPSTDTLSHLHHGGVTVKLFDTTIR